MAEENDLENDILRVGIVGAGANTKKLHIPGLKRQPGVEVVAVANRSFESGERVAQEFDIPQVAEHWLELVDDDDIDALCIGTWPYMHAPVSIAALEKGKHVLCEARMAMNASQAHEMLDISHQNPDLVAQIVPAPHTLHLDRTIIEHLASGYIGELIYVDAGITLGSDFPDWDSPWHWRHCPDLSGNNIMTMGIWYEAMMRWIGPATSVTALGQCVVRHRPNAQGRRVTMEIPDHLDILCRLARGGQMRCSVSTVIGHARGSSITLHGTQGTLEIAEKKPGEDFVLSGGRRGDKGLSPIDIAPEKRGGWRVEEEFINAVRGLEPVTHTDFATALRYMEWTDAVNLSLRTGETVHLPLFD